MKITPSRKISDIKEYYLQRKMKEVALLNSEGKDIISLGIGSPDLPPDNRVIETLCSEATHGSSHGYQVTSGIKQYRDAWSRFYQRHYGVSLDPETEILPLIGSKEGILYTTLALTDPGEKVLVPNPGYPTYTSASRLVGAQVTDYPLSPENGWQPEFDRLEDMDLTGVRILWINYPNMPTGAPAKMDTFEKAVDFGLRHNIVIVHDNPYSMILNRNPMSIMEVDGASEIAIELNSLSKSGNMPGWRMGVAVSNAEFINWILKVKSNVDSGQFRPAMLAAAIALDAEKQWFDKLYDTYSSRRGRAELIMSALGCDFVPGQSGMFLWGRITNPEIRSEELADRILRDCRVFITPGTVFGSRGEGYIRISLCAKPDRLEEALLRIKSGYHANS